MTYYREGKPQTATVTIAELPAAPECSCRWASASASAPRTKRVAEPSSRSTGSFPAARHFKTACARNAHRWPSANRPSRSPRSPNSRPPSARLDLSHGVPLEVQLRRRPRRARRLEIGKRASPEQPIARNRRPCTDQLCVTPSPSDCAVSASSTATDLRHRYRLHVHDSMPHDAMENIDIGDGT